MVRNGSVKMNYDQIKFNPTDSQIFSYYRQDLIEAGAIKDDIEVLIDTREGRSDVEPILVEEGAIVAGKKELDVGDYGFTGGTWFERKSFDFLNFGDVIMKASELVSMYPHPYVITDISMDKLIAILSKRTTRPYGQIHNQMIGVVASLAVRGVPPIFCPDKRTMVRTMISIARKHLDTKDREITKLQGARIATADDYLMGMYLNLPGIGRTLAEKLKEKFPTLKALVNATEEDFTSIPKIGGVKAKKILEIINGSTGELPEILKF